MTSQAKWIFVLIAVFLVCIFGAALAGIGYSWMRSPARPAAGSGSRQLFEGVSYQRLERTDPRPMVIHLVTVDLRAEGISFLVTPGDPKAELPLKARTTSQFLKEFNLQLAINGDGATPWHSTSIFDYYPHVGDPVKPIGFAASRGVVYAQDTDEEPTLYISVKNQASLDQPKGKVYNAVSGNQLLLRNGQVTENLDDSQPEPRTAIALDRNARRLIILVVDGRQPGYSEGATLADLAEILLENRAYNGMNLDGGGSSTLVIADQEGNPQVLNSPIDNLIPGRERPTGNHIGIFARPP
jgi:hypothetical protein